MKGPGMRVQLDVRRVWRCSRCGKLVKHLGEVTALACSCSEGAWMKLEERPRTRPLIPEPRAVVIEVTAKEILGDEEPPAPPPAPEGTGQHSESESLSQAGMSPISEVSADDASGSVSAASGNDPAEGDAFGAGLETETGTAELVSGTEPDPRGASGRGPRPDHRNRSEHRSNSRGDNRSEARAEQGTENRTDQRTSQRSENRSGGRSDQRGGAEGGREPRSRDQGNYGSGGGSRGGRDRGGRDQRPSRDRQSSQTENSGNQSSAPSGNASSTPAVEGAVPEATLTPPVTNLPSTPGGAASGGETANPPAGETQPPQGRHRDRRRRHRGGTRERKGQQTGDQQSTNSTGESGTGTPPAAHDSWPDDLVKE